MQVHTIKKPVKKFLKVWKLLSRSFQVSISKHPFLKYPFSRRQEACIAGG